MDYTSISLAAALKAMDDVVLPAVRVPGLPEVLEKAVLVRDALAFAASRVDQIGARERFELRHAAMAAGRLSAVAAGEQLESLQRLKNLAEHGMVVLTSAVAGDVEVRIATDQIMRAICALLEEVDSIAEGPRSRIESEALRAMKPRIEVDRAWLLPLGFDPDPDSAPELGAALKAPFSQT